jgi:hypothetical protein
MLEAARINCLSTQFTGGYSQQRMWIIHQRKTNYPQANQQVFQENPTGLSRQRANHDCDE